MIGTVLKRVINPKQVSFKLFLTLKPRLSLSSQNFFSFGRFDRVITTIGALLNIK